MKTQKLPVIGHFNLLLIFLLCIPVIGLAQKKKYPVIKSNKETVRYYVNGKKESWSISPELKPDRLEVYCDKVANTVKFKTDVDSIEFIVKNKDTLRFGIVLNGKDTALTEVVGVLDLPNTLSNTDKIFYLSYYWSEAKYNFVNMDKLTFDWDSLYHVYLKSVILTKNDYDYYQQLKKFAATLKDGHSEIVPGNSYHFYRDYICMTFHDIDKKIYITNLRKDIGLDSSYLGAELIEVEGLPVKQYLEQSVFPYISASTEQHLWMQGVMKLHADFKTKPFTGKVKKTNGEIKMLTLPHNGELTRSDQEKYWGRLFKGPNGLVCFKWLKDSIALIELNGFYPGDTVIKQFDAYISSINKAKGLIIDIRGNGGGSTDAALHIQACLTKGKYFLCFGSESRINDGVKKANGNWIPEWTDFYKNRACTYENPDTIFIADSIKRIHVPVVILIGRYTFSAAEDLLVNLYEVPGRPLFIGEPTGGSTGSPLCMYILPDGGYMKVCTRRICFPYSHKPFVNEGIKPDMLISPTIQEYLSYKDPFMDKAIELILKGTTSK